MFCVCVSRFVIVFQVLCFKFCVCVVAFVFVFLVLCLCCGNCASVSSFVFVLWELHFWFMSCAYVV